MKNYDELYFTINSNKTFVIKGLIDHKNHTPKKDGDISCEYKKIKFTNDKKIQVIDGKDIASNVEVYGEHHCSYSSHSEEKIIKELSFEELINSEYWENINNKYSFNDIAYERYKKSYVEENEHEIYVYCNTIENRYISFRFNKFNNQIDISSNNTDFCGNLFDLKLLEQEEFETMEEKSKAIDLMKNHKVFVLENGYVIDNVYYENIDDFEESKEN